jgi:hypothetical protein
VLHKPVIEEMKGDDVSLVVVGELSDYIICAIPRVDSLHNFLVRVSNLTKDEEENVSEEDSDNTSEDEAEDGEERHTKLLYFVLLSMFYRKFKYLSREKEREDENIFIFPSFIS